MINLRLEQDDIEMILEAINHRENFCKQQANKPIQGYGSAKEMDKKDEWKKKANTWRDLECKIAEQCN